jgi:hypothetical protein
VAKNQYANDALEASGVTMFFEISLIFSLRALRPITIGLLCAFAFK